jgi:hypothetical protein
MIPQKIKFLLLGLSLSCGLLSGEEGKPKPPPLATELAPQLLFKQETFRLPKSAAEPLLLAGLSDAQLYVALRKMVLAKTAQLSNLMLQRTRSGEQCKLEQIDEFGYATDMDPAQLPQQLTLINPRALGLKADPLPVPLRGPIPNPQPVPASNAGFGNMTTITPTVFTVRNLGDTMELNPLLNETTQRIALHCALESVQFAGIVRRNGIDQPQFETQKLNTQVDLTPGAPCFLGTLSKSCQTGTINANQDDQLSFCFMTASVDAPPAPSPSTVAFGAVRYQWELISLPKEAAASLLDEISDSTLLHEKLRAMIKTNAAKLEGIQSLGPAFPRGKVQAVDEFPYPSDIDSARHPYTLTIAEQRMMDLYHTEGGRDAPAPDRALDPANGGFGFITRAFPSAFTTRNAGDTLEIDSVLHDGGQSLHVSFAPERTRLLGLRKTEGIEQPLFETQRVQTHVNLEFNRPLLIGTMNPPINTGADHGNTEDRIWLSFLTAKAEAQEVAAYVPQQVLLREEWFTLPKEELRLMLAGGLSDAALRTAIQQRVGQHTATLDRFMMIRTKSGQRAKVEQIDEFPYPSDFNGGFINHTLTIVDAATVAAGTKLPVQPAPKSEPSLPQQPGHPLNGGQGLQTSAWGTTFNVRSLGDSWEVDPVIGEDLKTISLTFASHQVRFLDYVDYAGRKQPQFQTREIATSLEATSGDPILAGTCSRADNTGIKSGNDAGDVTVSFITPSITQIHRPQTAVPPVPLPVGDVRSARFQFELISLPAHLASALTDERLDDPALHQRLVKMMGEKQAQLEKVLSLRTKSGQRAKVEQIAETPYPTDFSVGDIIMQLTVADPWLEEIFRTGGRASTQAGHRPLLDPPNAGFGLMAGLYGSTWGVRNVGETVEIDPVIGDDGAFADITIAPESVRLVGQTQFSDSIQPVFETQKLNVSIVTGIGQPCLLGTMSKPSRTGAPGGNQTDRVWLAFITPFLD